EAVEGLERAIVRVAEHAEPTADLVRRVVGSALEQPKPRLGRIADALQREPALAGQLSVRRVQAAGRVAERPKLARLLVVSDAFEQLTRLHLHCLRSEEHTSELQSRVDLVCRLLLEK